jgi:hypothetical protein
MNVKQHVLISKTIWVIFGIILVINFGNEIQLKLIKKLYLNLNEYISSFQWYDIILIPLNLVVLGGALFLQILAFWTFLFPISTPKISKNINPEFTFHPFYFEHGRWGVDNNSIQPGIRTITFGVLYNAVLFYLVSIIEKSVIWDYEGSLLFISTMIISIYMVLVKRKIKKNNSESAILFFPVDGFIIKTDYISFNNESI